MRPWSPRRLALALAGLAAGCGGDPRCPAGDSIDDALAERCATNAMPPPGPATSCTPRAGTICTVVGTGVAGIGTDGVRGTASRAYLPQDVTVGPDDQAYFLDWNNHVIRVLRPSDRTVRTVVGTGELTDGDDPIEMPQGPEPALRHRLNHPTNIAFDAQGTMLVAAWHNSMIKRVTNVGRSNSLIEPICGTGARSFRGDGGPARMAVLDLPVGVAIHPTSGEVYIADQANLRIRVVNSMGVINTLVGNGMRGYQGDNGPAASAQLNNPGGQAAAPAGRIVFDAVGNLYIADTGNHAVRRVDRSGTITTVAGTGMPGRAGDGGPATEAQLNGPADVEVGPDGTLYIADTQNSCIRAVGSDGRIRTVAGRCGTRGFRGDGGPPGEALLDRPYGVETDGHNQLWISDTYNQRIRLVQPAAR